MRWFLLIFIALLLASIFMVGCTGVTSSGWALGSNLSAREKARRAAALANPEGPPYTYTWEETVEGDDGVVYTLKGQALVTL